MLDIEYLILGSGSSGNGGVDSVNYGHGGAGGTIETGTTTVQVDSYSIVVGASVAGTLQASSNAGNSSSFNGITATGGNSRTNTGNTGASNADFSGGTGTGTQGGGGAGSGANGSGINGGSGTSSSITGSAVTYGGGGSGGGSSTAGGSGGGGAGSGSSGGSVGGNGTNGLGGGGGGGTSTGGGGSSGSGIVILRYLTGTAVATGGTITTSGSYTIHSFTSNGTFEVTHIGTYSKGDESSLPGNDTDLENIYSESDIDDVSTSDNVRISQTGTNQYVLHQYKDDIGSATSCNLNWEGQTTWPPSSNPVLLQIYNRNTTSWETVDSDNSSSVNTDFVLNGNIADTTNYKDSNGWISCRVYQQVTF